MSIEADGGGPGLLPFAARARLRLPDDARHQRRPAARAAEVAQLDTPHLGAHLVVEELNDAGELERDHVRGDDAAQASRREVRLDLDAIVEAPQRLAPLIDPNIHSCGTVEPHGFRELIHPEPGFFIVGMKSYGRAPTFLLATGYEQVRSVTAWLNGDMSSASEIQLTLPATGVCSTDPFIGGGSCCS